MFAGIVPLGDGPPIADRGVMRTLCKTWFVRSFLLLVQKKRTKEKDIFQ